MFLSVLVCDPTWRSEVHLRRCSTIASPLAFWGSLSLGPGLANEARLATQGRLQIHQSPQCWDYRNTDHQGFLRWVLGIKLRSLGSLGKYGTDWVPSDLFIFLCVVWDLTTAHWMTQSSLCRPGWTWIYRNASVSECQGQRHVPHTPTVYIKCPSDLETNFNPYQKRKSHLVAQNAWTSWWPFLLTKFTYSPIMKISMALLFFTVKLQSEGWDTEVARLCLGQLGRLHSSWGHTCSSATHMCN